MLTMHSAGVGSSLSKTVPKTPRGFQPPSCSEELHQGGNNTRKTLLQQMHIEASQRLADMLCPNQSHPSSSYPARGPSKEFVLLKHPCTNVKLKVNIHQGDTTSRQPIPLWRKHSYQTCLKSTSWKIMLPILQYFIGTVGWKTKGSRCGFSHAWKIKCFKGIKEGTAPNDLRKGMVVSIPLR